MEDNTDRPFEPVHIGMANAETGVERFVTDGLLSLPRVALWRVNLTALSQKYNLYFVASASHIHVYEPQFPFQRLGGVPKLNITPQLANVHAQGYIQPREPHCINHIVIGNLGLQEILLLSTDSGNVVAYYTASILNAIRRDPSKFSQDAQAEYVGLRPFFSQWVFESAWGLAIHSKGRMIAVSANTPYHVDTDDNAAKITVFAFALGETGQDTHAEDSSHDPDSLNETLDWTPWTSRFGADDYGSDIPTRNRNYKIVLAGVHGHTNNIPCISFVNGSQDPEGSWLLSTDIHGEIKMWRIWRGRCVRTWNFSDRGSIGAAWLRRYEAGWSVAALDINSFRPAEGNEAFIGHRRAPQYYGFDASGPSYDLTNIIRQHVPSNSIYHPVNSDIDDEDTQSEADAIFEDISESEMTADEDETVRARKILKELSSTSSVFSPPTGADRSVTTASSHALQTNTAITQFLRSRPVVNETDAQSVDEDSDVYIEESEEEDDIEVQIESDFSDDEMSNTDRDNASITSPTSSASTSSPNVYQNMEAQDSSSPSSHRKRTPPSIAIGSDKSNRHRFQIPDVPFVHCSTSHLRMFSGTETKSPHIFCARMLKQILSPQMEGNPVAEMDRLNMIEQIPELGIIIIASQVGRCAVCTLTKRQTDGLPGLRVDWILPTRKEERKGVRPLNSSLLGIATGPVQGRFSKECIPISENDTEENWAKDRVIDGTLTTFDDTIVDMNHQAHILGESSEDDSSVDEDCTLEGDESTTASPLEYSPVPTRKHHWPRVKTYEEWMGVESSRRYRLMMTYADKTVLSYELSREVEKEDHDSRVSIKR